MNRAFRSPMLPSFARDQVEVPPQGFGSGGGGSQVDATREVIHSSFPSVAEITGAGVVGEPETLVAQTSKAWAGVDVYVTLPNPIPATVVASLQVFVYAMTNGQRVLAASGRVVPISLALGDPLAPTLFTPEWIASARGYADSWEVTAVWLQTLASTTPPGTVQFTVCASNDNAPIPEGLGSASMGTVQGIQGTGTDLGLAGIFKLTPPKLELLSVQGVNGAAAARFLHVHDLGTKTIAGVAGQVPILIFPMGAVAGAGVAVDGINYRARDGLVIVVSSTIASTTRVVDCVVSAMVR